MTSTFTPTVEQANVYKWLVEGRGHGVVRARAGTGKTTVLKKCADLIKTQGIYIAFGRHMVEELTPHFAGTRISAKTINSVGHGALLKKLGKVKLNDKKYRDLAEDWMAYNGYRLDIPEEDISEAINSLVKMCHLTRLTLTDPKSVNALDAMCERFGIHVLHSELLRAVKDLIEKGNALGEDGLIDYTDQVYLPVKWNLSLWGYPFVFVDEAQDLSKCSRELVYKLVGRGGRLVAVGDDRQAIMGFAGADTDSFHSIVREMNATELPLTVCFRCPSKHLDLARRIVSDIQPRDGAPAGSIAYIDNEELNSAVQLGDLIVCRQTSPVVGLCIKLIGQRIPARVRGRDIGKDLMSVVNRVRKMKGWTYATFTEYLEKWQVKQVAQLRQRDADEGQIESLTDRVACIQTCVAAFTDCHDIVTFEAEMTNLFSDDTAGVWLSTIHRAKGLEADRVFILKPEKLPLQHKRQTLDGWIQEMNLKYVALTRSKKLLFVVGREEDLFKPEGDYYQPWIESDDTPFRSFAVEEEAPVIPVVPTPPKPRNQALEVAQKAVAAQSMPAMVRLGRQLANLVSTTHHPDAFNKVNDLAGAWLITDPSQKKHELAALRRYLQTILDTLPRD